MNPKIHRNFQIFASYGFIAAITQHIPDKSFQLVRDGVEMSTDWSDAVIAGASVVTTISE